MEGLIQQANGSIDLTGSPKGQRELVYSFDGFTHTSRGPDYLARATKFNAAEFMQ